MFGLSRWQFALFPCVFLFIVFLAKAGTHWKALSVVRSLSSEVAEGKGLTTLLFVG